MGKVLLASPRGYCAGVDRAVTVVQRALERFGAPVYVRKEIVHNKFVVRTLAAAGAVFVSELHEVPSGSRVIFSAHGVAPAVYAEAEARGLEVIDATCPLVTKVHREAKRFADQGYDIILIGHQGHEEVEGTQGVAPDRIRVIDTNQDVSILTGNQPETPGKNPAPSPKERQDFGLAPGESSPNPARNVVPGSQPELAPHESVNHVNHENAATGETDGGTNGKRKMVWLSQTTLSVDQTNETVARLKLHFPGLESPPSGDICFATQNRQGAVKAMSPQCDVVIVVGSANSSNSVRLMEVAREAGAGASYRVDGAGELCADWFEGAKTVGLTSGASVPEVLVDEVLQWLAAHGFDDVEPVETLEETTRFALPRDLR